MVVTPLDPIEKESVVGSSIMYVGSSQPEPTDGGSGAFGGGGGGSGGCGLHGSLADICRYFDCHGSSS